jgi:5-oxoprolinase (ATP-hydrolysing) subunit A
MKSIDLNSDMGEGYGVYRMGDDAGMLEIVTSANIACGFHAGDPLIMHDMVKRAGENGVAIGAHPSFLDLWGFGRRPIHGERPADIEKIIAYQIGALQGIAASLGRRVSHVKTHGSLGNMVAVDDALAAAVARAVAAVDRSLILVVMPGMATERAGAAADLPLMREIYADRTYGDDGNLTPRKEPGAVIHDAEAAAARVLRMVEEQRITTTSGKAIPVAIDSVCVHGDTPDSVVMARRIRAMLEGAGYAVRPFSAR